MRSRADYRARFGEDSDAPPVTIAPTGDGTGPGLSAEARALIAAATAYLDECKTRRDAGKPVQSFALNMLTERERGVRADSGRPFRLTEKMAQVLIDIRDREQERRSSQPRIDEVIAWLRANSPRNTFAASLLRAFGQYGSLTPGQYAAVIRSLEQTPATPGPRTPRTTGATEGWYKLDGVIYKVQKAVHGSGNLYAKRLDPETGDWDYVPGMAMRLSDTHRLAREEAAAMGKLYGRCMVCGRTLTDETSIGAGIGPVCAGRLGES